MHILFVHQNFPAQFGHVARHLVRELGYRCTFVSRKPPGRFEGVRNIQYRLDGGATEKTHFFSRTFENAVWHAAGVYDALKAEGHRVRPDLVVGHSGFGSTLFLSELYPEAKVINYFEYFYRPHNSDMDFRPEWAPSEKIVLRSRARNAMILLDLEYCRAGYSPTQFQRNLMPTAYREKVSVIHDGIDTAFWRRHDVDARQVGDLVIDADTRIVTYVSRGLESMRGFDIFMRAAKLIYQRFPNVVFLVVASDRVAYGGDLAHTGGKSFKEFVLAQDDYDLDRIRFLGNVSPHELARILSLSDLHIYLTVPFVLSWSMLDAMACECTVLASGTPPVREFIKDGQNGLLVDFFDADELAAKAVSVLEDPGAFRPLGKEARRLIQEQYSLEVIVPRMVEFYESVAG